MTKRKNMTTNMDKLLNRIENTNSGTKSLRASDHAPTLRIISLRTISHCASDASLQDRPLSICAFVYSLSACPLHRPSAPCDGDVAIFTALQRFAAGLSNKCWSTKVCQKSLVLSKKKMVLSKIMDVVENLGFFSKFMEFAKNHGF